MIILLLVFISSLFLGESSLAREGEAVEAACVRRSSFSCFTLTGMADGSHSTASPVTPLLGRFPLPSSLSQPASQENDTTISAFPAPKPPKPSLTPTNKSRSDDMLVKTLYDKASSTMERSCFLALENIERQGSVLAKLALLLLSTKNAEGSFAADRLDSVRLNVREVYEDFCRYSDNKPGIYTLWNNLLITHGLLVVINPEFS